jgi:hypothetical protein
VEEVDGIPASLEICRRAVVGLAHWQLAHTKAGHPWLSEDWIATSVGRQRLDNDRTLSHPAWPSLIKRGVDPSLRDWVRARVTEPVEIRRLLSAFPHVLANLDFHTHNIGTVGDQVVLIDWAYVGWAPIGHDVGHLASSLIGDGVDLTAAWPLLETAYCDALHDAGWSGDLAEVRRSMAVSTVLRMGWAVDRLLETAEHLPDDALGAMSRALRFLTDSPQLAGDAD